MVDEDRAVKVVKLMLQANGEKAGGLDFERFAVKVLGAHGDAIGAAHLFIKSLEGKAAFFEFGKLLRVGLDVGIDEDEKVVLLRSAHRKSR